MEKRYLLFGFSLIFLLLLAFQLTTVLGHDDEQIVDVPSETIDLDYEHFRLSLVSRDYALEEYELTQEFHFFQQLAQDYPALDHDALFDVYYSLRISYLEDSLSDNLF